jgi:hypothetical protein
MLCKAKKFIFLRYERGSKQANIFYSDFQRAIEDLTLGLKEIEINDLFTDFGGTSRIPIQPHMIDCSIEDTLTSTIDTMTTGTVKHVSQTITQKRVNVNNLFDKYSKDRMTVLTRDFVRVLQQAIP